MVELGLPFEHASIVSADGDEVPLIVSKHTLGDIIQMIRVALVITIIVIVGVTIKPNGSYLVTDRNNWLVGHLDDIQDLIVCVVLLSDGL